MNIVNIEAANLPGPVVDAIERAINAAIGRAVLSVQRHVLALPVGLASTPRGCRSYAFKRGDREISLEIRGGRSFHAIIPFSEMLSAEFVPPSTHVIDAIAAAAMNALTAACEPAGSLHRNPVIARDVAELFAPVPIHFFQPVFSFAGEPGVLVAAYQSIGGLAIYREEGLR